MSDVEDNSLKDIAEGDEPERFVTLGRVSGAHGIKGWVRLHSETRPRENIAAYSPLYLGDGAGREALELEDVRVQGKHLVAKLAGCDDRDRAEALKGMTISVSRSQLPDDTQPGEFYWTDLQGLRVCTVDGVELGIVDHLFETGSNDVLVVKGERERLLPYIWGQVVVEVDLDARRMVVDWDPEF